MEVKPGYKQTEVGVIPAEWSVTTIGEVAVVDGGFAFSSRVFLPSGKYQVVKMSNLYGGNLDLERSASYLDSLSNEQRPYRLHRDEIIITLTGTTGKRDYGYSYKIDREQNLLLNQRVGRLIVREIADPSYVAFQLRTPCFLDQFFELSKGGTGNQTNVGTQDVAEIHLPVPPLPEQRAIAAALSDVDALLGGLERLIAKKRDLKQAAMQQLLTGQTRLPGFHGEWEVKRLEESCDTITKGTTPTSIGRHFTASGVNFLKAESISETGDPLPDKVAFIDSATHKLLKRSQLKEGDLLISIAGVLGRVGRASRDILPANTNQALAIVRLGSSSELERSFLFYCLRSPMTTKQISDVNVQAAQANISLQNVRDLKSHVPPTRSEQSAIAAVLSDMDVELAVLEARRAKTRALKQGMMQELLTGRTRLI